VEQIEIVAHALALLVLLAAGVAAWLLSVVLRDVSIVDVLWGPMFLLIALVHWLAADPPSARAFLVLILIAAWSLRLAGYLAWRNWGQDEDRRYQRIRAANEPGFWWKSLYIVFGLQVALAWVVALPLAGGMHAPDPLGFLAGLGVALWSLGLFFETVGDLQLAAFKRDPANRGRVMDRGLWRYTRHPNYFGDFCVWWGFYLIALDGGAWWSFVGPLLMTVLLLKVSGVALLERGMGKRPEYAEYIRTTSTFFPWPPRSV
jgi:steroid 5-alpha reductase family enzyme